MREHLTVVLGLNKAGFEAGLGAARQSVKGMSRLLGMLGAGLSIGAAVSFVGRIRDLADELTTTADGLAITTDFLQRFQWAAEQAGSSSENASKALQIFGKSAEANGLSTGNMERDIRKAMDTLSAIKDPATRARQAVDMFGKAAIELIPLLSKGSIGFDEFAKGAKMLSEVDLRHIDTLDKSLKSLSDDAKVGGGMAMGWAVSWGTALADVRSRFDMNKIGLGEWFDAVKASRQALVEDTAATAAATAQAARLAGEREHATKVEEGLRKAYGEAGEQALRNLEAEEPKQETLNRLLRTRDAVLKEIAKNPARSIDNAKRLLAIEKMTSDINKAQLDIDRERATLAEQIAGAQERAGSAAVKQGDRTASTLQEVAEGPAWTREGWRQKSFAGRALSLEAYAKQARKEGRTDLETGAMAEADRLKGTIGALSDEDRNAGAKLAEEAAKTSATLAELLRKANEEGLNIQPRNG